MGYRPASLPPPVGSGPFGQCGVRPSNAIGQHGDGYEIGATIFAVVIYLLILGTPVALAFAAIDSGLGTTDPIPCTVIERVYRPSASGAGLGMTMNGQLGIVATGSPESYNLILRLPDGRVESTDVTPETWAATGPGRSFGLPATRGRFTGHLYR